MTDEEIDGLDYEKLAYDLGYWDADAILKAMPTASEALVGALGSLVATNSSSNEYAAGWDQRVREQATT